jgi:preprotein translocase subunit SecY
MVMSGMFLALFSLIPECSNAQIGDPGDDPDAPIDGGVSLLVAAGVGYGIKKAKESRKKNKTVALAQKME